MIDPADMRLFAPSTERNREPIYQVLRSILSPGAKVLEVASGAGEHAVYLSEALEVSDWWPTDVMPEALTSIRAWRSHTGSNRVHVPLMLDVSEYDTVLEKTREAGIEPGSLDGIVCINMIHIAPWRACEGLMRCAPRLLRTGGIVYLYGPYKRNGAHTAPSNQDFDLSLKQRNEQWGVRNLETVCDLAHTHGLDRLQVTEMPANNLSVIFCARGAK
jgi:SAM-dependent methyltransferase